MRGKTVLTIVLVVLGATLVIGCSEAEGRYTFGLQSSGSPLGTPIPGDKEPVAPGDEGTVIDSEGEVYTAPGVSGGKVAVPGGPEPAVREEVPVSQWELYRNDTYGYEIRYPPHYIILPDYILLEAGAKGGEREPQPLHQVWFQDKGVAESEIAAMEPPKFSIEVFDNKSQLSVEEWLSKHGLHEGLQVEAYTLAGVKGVRIRSMFLMGANEFVYLPKDNYVFKLTPLGQLAEQMLATFKFSPTFEPLG